MALIEIDKKQAAECLRLIWELAGVLVEGIDNVAREKEASLEERFKIQNLADCLKKDLRELGELYEDMSQK